MFNLIEATPMKMKSKTRITVAFNGDDRLIDSVAACPGVESIYGKVSKDVVGGGRPSYLVADIGMAGLAKSIRIAHERGLQFHYLLNSSCMGNQELSRATNRQIHALLDSIVEAGVDGVVLALPYLLALVKKRYPRLKASISTFAGVGCSQRARIWEDRGADRLVLPPNVNRDRTKLEKIRQAVKCELELFANVMCTYQCPFDFAHASSNGHASSSTDSLKGFGIEYHSYQCAERRLDEPSEIIRGRFIRPEDVGVYEEIGIDVVKLSDRLRSTPWITRAVAAYSSRRYDGNLADLISYPVFMQNGEQPLTNPARFLARTSHANVALLNVLQGIEKCETPIYIDNRKLDGFLDYYFQHDCERSTCGVDCRYCESVTERAVTIDTEKKNRCLSHIRELNQFVQDRDAFAPDHPIAQLAMTMKRRLTSKRNNFGNAPDDRT
jgi:collagenase-like PrtC family protease